ncbi:MAG: hypothetical protein P4L56_12025 [Candidatus Sulfopaludibacter sp.]|nr:hypothetical protein [Candidatus Sulfopaludibacter sp.]
MAETQNTSSRPSTANLWERARVPVTLALAGLFNVASACYNFRGLQLLEGDMPLLTIPLGIGLAISKTIAEKEFCANIFRKRPLKMIGVTAAFLLFGAVAVVFNALNVLHHQAGILADANRAQARGQRWQHDTSALTETRNQIRSAATRRLETIESQLRDEQLRIDAARKAGDTPSYAERDRLRSEQRTLGNVQGALNGLSPLPIDPPSDVEEGSRLLSASFSKLRDLRAQLAEDLQRSASDPKPSTEAPVTKHPALMLFEETAKRSTAARVSWTVAVILELLAFAAIILGQPALTFADRIHGLNLVWRDVAASLTSHPHCTTIPFLIAGTATRGYLSVDGSRPLFQDELKRAIEEIQPTLQMRITGMRTTSGDELSSDRDVLDQLDGRELVLEGTL